MIRSLFNNAGKTYRTLSRGMNSPAITATEKTMVPAFAAAATIGIGTLNPGLVLLGAGGLAAFGHRVSEEGRAIERTFTTMTP